VGQLEDALREVPTGGRTPLAGALHEAANLSRRYRPSVVVLFTDGRANVSLAGGDPWEEAQAACGVLAESCAGSVVVDCEAGPISLGRAQRLADALLAQCISIAAGSTGEVVLHLQERMASP
jgi:magnesium chelatase subunit D